MDFSSSFLLLVSEPLSNDQAMVRYLTPSGSILLTAKSEQIRGKWPCSKPEVAKLLITSPHNYSTARQHCEP